MRKVLQRLGCSVLALLLSLAAAEVLVRRLGAAPEVSLIRVGRFQLSRNPKIGYEPVPGMVYEGKERSFWDYEGASNSLGYRDGEHQVAKPAGVYRIVVLGDSIATGLKVERYEEVFPPVLEKLLAARKLPAEVINLSVSGYNTRQEVETLKERGLRYRPDLVLVAYSLTDREEVDGDILRTLLERERDRGAVSPAMANPLLVRSALYRFFRYRVAGTGAGDPEEERRLAELLGGDTVAESMAELARLSRESGFAVLVAVFPRIVRSFGAYRFWDQHEWIGAVARRNGFHVLDLLGPFRDCRARSPEPLGMDNWHPSPYGHRCAAEAMADTILKEIRPARR